MVRNRRESGFSLLSLLVTVLLVATVFIPAIKVMPSLLEYQSVKRAANQAKAQGTSASSAIAAFDRQALVDGVQSVRGRDLEILTNANGGVEFVRFSYRREILLYGPVSLAIQYSGSAR
jgi:type II secretory pathway component PulJ